MEKFFLVSSEDLGAGLDQVSKFTHDNACIPTSIAASYVTQHTGYLISLGYSPRIGEPEDVSEPVKFAIHQVGELKYQQDPQKLAEKIEEVCASYDHAVCHEIMVNAGDFVSIIVMFHPSTLDTPVE